MINYFNFEKTDNGYLITNDLGYYSFISEEVFSQNAADWLRSIKSYCFGCTALHIFAVTNACNLSCIDIMFSMQVHIVGVHVENALTSTEKKASQKGATNQSKSRE